MIDTSRSPLPTPINVHADGHNTPPGAGERGVDRLDADQHYRLVGLHIYAASGSLTNFPA